MYRFWKKNESKAINGNANKADNLIFIFKILFINKMRIAFKFHEKIDRIKNFMNCFIDIFFT